MYNFECDVQQNFSTRCDSIKFSRIFKPTEGLEWGI